MFEAAQEKQESGSSKLWIGLFVIVAVVALGVLYFTMQRGAANDKAAAKAATAKVVANADPVKDLKITRAKMDKDPLGATAVWALTVENKSDTFSYSEIKYHADYMGADDKIIAANDGTTTLYLRPGAEGSADIRDIPYPTGTARFKIKVTGAKAAIE